MKLFLLIAGDQHYPQTGNSDWKGTFDSTEEAQEQVSPHPSGEGYSLFGTSYQYDWYKIVNLADWIYT
jgi:hypothetical protein